MSLHLAHLDLKTAFLYLARDEDIIHMYQLEKHDEENNWTYKLEHKRQASKCWNGYFVDALEGLKQRPFIDEAYFSETHSCL